MRTYALRCAPSIEGQAFELAEAHDRVALAVESRGAVVAARDDRRFELDLRRLAIFGGNRANLLDRGFHARESAPRGELEDSGVDREFARVKTAIEQIRS